MRTAGRAARALGVVLGMLSWVGNVGAQVSVTTYHNDNSRTGANTQETILSPSNVNSGQFGKLFSVTVDGAVYAQPLYLANLTIAGGTHNVLYIATEHDSVYAIDADSGTIYAQVSLIPTGGSTVNSSTDLSCGDLVPEIGITGTPVIDPSSGTLYVVAKSKVNGSIVQYLHALDVATLADKFGGPMLIQASVTGSGYDSSGGHVAFNSKMQNQRAALALTNGHVIIGWSSHCDNDPWHGWIMSFNATSLGLEGAFNSSPNSSRGGIWMSGAAPAVDASGNLYLATGNGVFDANSDYGDSILKLGPPSNGALPVLDYFTPYNQSALNGGDVDLASGGLALLPPLASGHQLLAQQGKSGTIVLLDTANLGKYCVNLSPPCSGSDTQIVQEIQNASSGIWGSPAFWNGNLYWTGANDSINAYSFNAGGSGLISTQPTSRSAQIFAFSAPTPTVSANGTTNGILWALDGSADDSTCDGGGSACLGLFAYDATNLGNLLYTSSQAANNRDSPGVAVKFEKPIVANGKVYVGTQSSVTVYGLLSGLPAVAVPTFSPAGGSFSSAQSVSLADTTPGAVIHYTTNGTTPSASSAQYNPSSPIQVSSTTTIEAIAIASGYANSPVASATYTITGSSSPVSVNLSSVDNVYGIVNTGTAFTNGGLDGDGCAYAAALLGSSINWAGETFSIGSAGVADAVSNTVVTLPAGSYSTLSLLATAVNGNQAAKTLTVTYTDGTSTTFTQSFSDWYTPQNYSGESEVLSMPYRITSTGASDNRTFYLYGYSFALNSSKTVKSLTLPATRNVVVLAMDLVPSGAGPSPAATPTFSPAGGSFSSAQSVSLADSTPGAVIYYTTNGTTPSTSSTQYNPSSPIQVSTTTTIEAIAVASGYSNSPVASATYTITATPASAPTFSPAGGSFSSAQSVSLADTTPGAVIHYTTNGTTPSASSAQYNPSSPIQVSTTTTIEAIAIASGYSNSPVASATYTITGSSSPVSVNLSSVDNVYGIVNTGTAFTNGGLDGDGCAYAAALLGSSINWAGETFSIGSAGVADAVSNTVVTLPAGSYSTLSLLATAVNGNQAAKTLTVTYTDGTSTTFTQSFSDWYTPQNYSGESEVLSMPYRITSTGASDNRTFYLYGYSFALNSSKTVKSLTLPATRNVVVLAMDLVPSGAGPSPAATPTFSPAGGSFSSAQSVSLADSTPGAVIYYTTNGTTPSTSSTQYNPSSPIQVSTT